MDLTDGQKGVAGLLGENDDVSCKSGHGAGKSALAAALALWFKYSYTPSIVLTTAPTERQVKEVLWREIRYRKMKSKIYLPGKPLTMKLDLGPIDYMLGFSTNDVQQMQGFHNPNIMIIVDESNGYDPELFAALLGLVSGGIRKVLFQIGNPIVPVGPFFDSFSDGHTKTATLSCLDHPNVISGEDLIPGAVTLKWVDKMRKLWGEDSAFWQSRVLGQFPRIASDIIISIIWFEQAEEMKKTKSHDEGPLYMGVDVPEYGEDKAEWFIGKKRSRVETVSRSNVEPSAVIGLTKQLIKKYSLIEENVTIDGIGAGAVVYSVLKEDFPKIRRFVASETAVNENEFENKGTEAWWNVRNMLNPASDQYEEYFIGKKCEQLKSDLCSRKYRTSSHGRIMLEPKPEFRKRMKRSPDKGDSMTLCYYPLICRYSYGLITLPDVIGDY
ncbi:MAG: hypothetical protein FVQ80_11410 [Planctomycetes bacterium]|nr:hypothetical protein [Planctomycetota bacterium]